MRKCNVLPKSCWTAGARWCGRDFTTATAKTLRTLCCRGARSEQEGTRVEVGIRVTSGNPTIKYQAITFLTWNGAVWTASCFFSWLCRKYMNIYSSETRATLKVLRGRLEWICGPKLHIWSKIWEATACLSPRRAGPSVYYCMFVSAHKHQSWDVQH